MLPFVSQRFNQLPSFSRKYLWVWTSVSIAFENNWEFYNAKFSLLTWLAILTSHCSFTFYFKWISITQRQCSIPKPINPFVCAISFLFPDCSKFAIFGGLFHAKMKAFYGHSSHQKLPQTYQHQNQLHFFLCQKNQILWPLHFVSRYMPAIFMPHHDMSRYSFKSIVSPA